MTNLDTRIIYDANGKPIPQYLDVTDNTDGTAGTMKPITKNSYPEIQDVNVTNQQALPTDYPDSAVKQELELIKAQQQQILERLDEPVPTQLTGSIAEYKREYLSFDNQILAGTNDNLIIKPPTGKAWLIRGLSFEIRGSASATSGSIRFRLGWGGLPLGASPVSVFNEVFNISQSNPKGHISRSYTQLKEGQTEGNEYLNEVIKSLVVSDENELYFRLDNFTDETISRYRIQIIFDEVNVNA